MRGGANAQPIGMNSPVRGIAFSPDGELLASVRFDFSGKGLEGGAILSEIGPVGELALRDYGRNLGMAFQIVDADDGGTWIALRPDRGVPDDQRHAGIGGDVRCARCGMGALEGYVGSPRFEHAEQRDEKLG